MGSPVSISCTYPLIVCFGNSKSILPLTAQSPSEIDMLTDEFCPE